MDTFITIDTMYLHIKYPKRDVFDFWYPFIKDTDPRLVKQGKVINDHVVKGGASGYRVSVWLHDARVYLTDQVDEKCGEGKGMGVWVQLGPKFLLEHINNLHEAVKNLLVGIGIIKDIYPISISRLDLAVDLLGVSMQDQDIQFWKDGWVGRSKVSAIFNNSRTGNLETIYIGSRKSPVFLRIYDKVAQSIVDGDYVYWKDVWKGFEGPVVRVEWEVKPKDGHFTDDLKDFRLLNGFSVRELANYLLDWGRLCTPDFEDCNRNRWKDSPLWEQLRELVSIWCDEVSWPTSRYGKEFHGVSDAYIKSVSGTISGAMARLGLNDPSLLTLFQGLTDHGEPPEKIIRKAKKKAEIIKRL
jgi:hypothetical protein